MKELSIEQIDRIKHSRATDEGFNPEVGRPFFFYNGAGRIGSIPAVNIADDNGCHFIPVGYEFSEAHMYPATEYIYVDDYIAALSGGAE